MMKTFAILIMGLLVQFPMFSRADATKEGLDRMCQRDLDIYTSCCLEGKCVIPDGIDSKRNVYALPVDLKFTKRLRMACELWHGKPADTCPRGVSIEENIETLRGGANCPSKVTRVVTYSIANARILKGIQDDKSINVVKEQGELCKQWFKEFKGKVGRAACSHEYADEKIKNYEESFAKQQSEFLTNPAKRKKDSSGKYESPFLNNLYDSTCVHMENANGFFEESTLPQGKEEPAVAARKVLDDLANQMDFTPEEREEAFSRACWRVSTSEREHKSKEECTENIYFKIDKQSVEKFKPRKVTPDEEKGVGVN